MNRELIQERIHKLRCSDDPKERIKALEQLRSNFPLLPDKEKAGNDLHKLAKDDNSDVRRPATLILSELFHYIPDKQTAWKDLHNRTKDIDNDVRWMATFAIGPIYSEVPNQQQAWNDLHKLTYDKNNGIRGMAAKSLRSAFPHISNKEEVWNDLHRLTHDEDGIVRGVAAKSLRSAFPYISDKESMWNDLHRLSVDEDYSVRLGVTSTLGSSYSHIPDKETALGDLYKLANDEKRAVQSAAYHSLGKISVFKASQAENEEEYRKELENAIEFFEKASQESISSSSSQFCLPFYRSFHTILFNKNEAKEEVNKYLAEAKGAINGSRSKEQLLKVVEKLANALEKVQNLEYMDLESKKSKLNSYREKCEHADDLFKETEQTSPFATEVLRKGLPILDRNLKELIEEIQNKAKIACQVSQDTPAQEIACAVNQEVKSWEIGSQEEMGWYVATIVMALNSKIPHAPENEEVLYMIESMKYEKDLAKQYRTLSTVIGLIPTVNVVPEKTVKEGFKDLQRGISKIEGKLEEMTVSLKPGPRGELVISKGLNIAGSGAQLVTTIPLAEMKYPEMHVDLEKIKGEATKLSELPARFIDKIKGYLP